MVLIDVFPKKIYLDTSIFIAEFDKSDLRHKILTSFFEKIKRVKNVELCYSRWALTEVFDVLTRKQIEELNIYKYLNSILNKNKIRGFNLRSLEVCSNPDYNFPHFFDDLGKDLKKCKSKKSKPSLADIIHRRIMKNNRIKTILTFDADFEKLPGIVSINLFKTEDETKK